MDYFFIKSLFAKKFTGYFSNIPAVLLNIIQQGEIMNFALN